MHSLIKRLNHYTAVVRLLLCFTIAVALFAMTMWLGQGLLTGIMLSWDAFCLLMIVLNWITFVTVEQQGLTVIARAEDESRTITFVLVLCSVCVSLIGIIALMNNVDESLVRKEVHKAISLAGVALSWGLLHTVFTLRYAHLYYADDTKAPAEYARGLDFPDDDAPDYLDFAYFSFVVGMTFQVSDVEVRSKMLRRVVLLHGFISFVFNTAIVALTISIISNSVK